MTARSTPATSSPQWSTWRIKAQVWTAAQRPNRIAAADIDGDGRVNSTDIYYMLYYVALHGAGQKVSWEDVIS
ncbi:MAG: dockerin type I domain-containing protein [Ruminococcus sp.]